MASEYLCNLVVPGAGKSGTSSLHEYLGAHPMISMSSSKEPHHFCRDTRYAEGAQAHNALFNGKPGARYFGESSTGYLPWAPAAERVARDLDRPKIIIILRHPVERCFSHYRWRYRLGLEKRSFLEAVTRDGFGYNPEKPSEFGYMAYLEFSQYATQCSIWESAVGSEHCLFISSEDMLKDRRASLELCFAFLDLPCLEDPEAAGKQNQTAELGRRPSRSMTRVAGILPDAVKSFPLYRKMRNRLLKAAAPEPPATMTAEEREFVENSLAEDIAWYETRFGARIKAIDV